MLANTLCLKTVLLFCQLSYNCILPAPCA